jgi:hypothetical protein
MLVRNLSPTLPAPTVEQHLAAIRHLFDWLMTRQVVPHNAAASVRGRSHTTRKGKTSVLDASEAGQLLDSIDGSTPIVPAGSSVDCFDGVFVRACGCGAHLCGEDVYVQNKRLWVRLREKTTVAQSTR